MKLLSLAPSGLVVALLLQAGPATAQRSQGNLTLQATLANAQVTLPGCTPTLDIKTASGTGAQHCALPDGGSGTVTNKAHFEAPTAFDPANPSAYALAKLGASSSAEVELMSTAGTPHDVQSRPQAVLASAWVGYTDYLLLGPVRPTTLTLQLHLSGSLSLGAAFAPGHVWQANESHSLFVQSGRLDADGSFGSFDPFGVAGATTQQQLRAGMSSPDTTYSFIGSASGNFSYTELPAAGGGTDITMTLRNAFFSNPANDVLALDMQLLTSIYAPAWDFANLPYGTVLTGNEVKASFGNTLVMTGLQALDADGNDITASAVLGLQSLQPVPEPGSAMLLCLGLLALFRRSRRREP